MTRLGEAREFRMTWGAVTQRCSSPRPASFRFLQLFSNLGSWLKKSDSSYFGLFLV